jgi:hypothetical protein
MIYLYPSAESYYFQKDKYRQELCEAMNPIQSTQKTEKLNSEVCPLWIYRDYQRAKNDVIDDISVLATSIIKLLIFFLQDNLHI